MSMVSRREDAVIVHLLVGRHALDPGRVVPATIAVADVVVELGVSLADEREQDLVLEPVGTAEDHREQVGVSRRDRIRVGLQLVVVRRHLEAQLVHELGVVVAHDRAETAQWQDVEFAVVGQQLGLVHGLGRVHLGPVSADVLLEQRLQWLQVALELVDHRAGLDGHEIERVAGGERQGQLVLVDLRLEDVDLDVDVGVLGLEGLDHLLGRRERREPGPVLQGDLLVVLRRRRCRRMRRPARLRGPGWESSGFGFSHFLLVGPARADRLLRS